MRNVFRTYILKAAQGAVAQAITEALGYPEEGMFASEIDDGTLIGYISSGIVDAASPLHGSATELLAALTARKPGHGITLAQCQSFKDALDQTDAEPWPRMDLIRAEIAQGATAVPWVQPTGAHDAYGLDAAVTHGGQAWRSTVAANVWEPGVSGWRKLWASTAAPPDWVQPTGGHDAYAKGTLVTYKGKVYKSLIDANVWSPEAYPAGWEAQP